MPKNILPEADLWQVEFDIDEGKLLVNGKDCSELENTITQGALDTKLSWWEFAALMMYVGIGQIAGKDREAQDTMALRQYTGLMGHLYSLFLQSLARGDIEVVSKPDTNHIN